MYIIICKNVSETDDEHDDETDLLYERLKLFLSPPGGYVRTNIGNTIHVINNIS
jgi:hypothetical protein